MDGPLSSAWFKVNIYAEITEVLRKFAPDDPLNVLANLVMPRLLPVRHAFDTGLRPVQYAFAPRRGQSQCTREPLIEGNSRGAWFCGCRYIFDDLTKNVGRVTVFGLDDMSIDTHGDSWIRMAKAS